MKEYIQVSMTTENQGDARKIVREVVEKRLAACGQVIGPISSTYWWKGKMEETQEWLCLMKTGRDLYGQLEGVIRGIHPYDVPEIVAVPITQGSRAYLDWIDKECTPGT